MVGAGAPQAVDLSTVGAPGCSLYTQPFTTVNLPLVGDGFADLMIPVLNDPGLIGFQVTIQAVSTNVRANALGVISSNALSIVVGQ